MLSRSLSERTLFLVDMPGELKVAAALTQGFSSHYPPKVAAVETSQEEGEKYSAQLGR